MTDTGQAETPVRDHVARFWRYLETDTVRILLDLKRIVGVDSPDGPVVYWDGSSFSDDVAKALLAERERLRAALEEYECPGLAHCPVQKLKDGSCINAGTGHCGDTAFKALHERN